MRKFWTDGSAVPNPGAGGFAVLEDGEPVVLGSEDPSTNIRMEAYGIIEALRLAGGEECEIYTDSQFWINAMKKWAPEWERRGWRKNKGRIANLDLVMEMYVLYGKSRAKLVWVRGHVGTEYNELADSWANRAREGERL
jgi:ribonuclease HI